MSRFSKLWLFAASVVMTLAASPALAYARARPRWSVPEFDPAVVGVIAAVVAGGGVLLARRRKR